MDFTTPRLLLQYQEAVAGLNAGLVSRREFRAFVKGLRDQQVKLNRRAAAARAKREAKAEAERQRRLAEMARAEAAREAARRERQRLARIRRRVNVVFDQRIGDNVTRTLVDAWRASSAYGTLRVLVGDEDFEIQHTRSSREWVRQFFYPEMKVETGDRLLILAPTRLAAERIRQAFRDGINHCVFTPILSKLENSLKSAESSSSKLRFKQRIAKLELLSQEYANGVPVEDMELVAKTAGFKIQINDILGKEILTFNEKGKSGQIKFTNTRRNHVDEGLMTLNSDSIKVTPQDMLKKWTELKRNKEFYMIEGDLKNDQPRKIHTMSAVYEIENPDMEYYYEMDERIDLQRCRLNATKYPEVNEFIKAGRIINAWVTPFTDQKPTGHIDMPKAYTQFKKCAWYSGFLGVIHQWRYGPFDRAWIEQHIGMYQVRMSTTNPMFMKLGLGGVHILPSPEILYFMDNGVDCEITAGVWGSRMDFEFPEEMLTDRRYCIWSGRLSREQPYKKYSFHCDREWASHLKADYGEDCFYWEDKKLCTLKLPVNQIYTAHHILAFLTSYVRIQMMEAMKQFDLDQIVKVVLDGIYFVGEKPGCLDWFRPKEIVDHSCAGFGWYENVSINVKWSPMWISRNTLLMGQGGSGKTYKVLTDTGFNRILFVTPQHVLGGDVMNKYGVSYTTIHKLIGQECESYLTTHSYPPVLFIDEITQINAEWVDKVFKMYKDSLILLAGDLTATMWFQTRNGKPGEFSKIWKPVGVDLLEIGGDRRSKDTELRDLKLKIRDKMQRVFVDGDSGEDVRMKIWAYDNLPIMKMSEAVKLFEQGDVWIAGTNETSRKLLEAGVCSGWYKQGGFISFEEKEGYTKRGSFTIHSFQGRTLETGRVFISISDMFEFTMLYTAVSRAVEFKQLVFVGV